MPYIIINSKAHGSSLLILSRHILYTTKKFRNFCDIKTYITDRLIAIFL